MLLDDRLYGPVSLALVCRFWHAIVTACPDLWTSIIFERSFKSSSHYAITDHAIRCKDWSNLERALTRAGTATLSLAFYSGTRFYPRDEEERVLRLFPRCHELCICLTDADRYTFASSLTMPHLEKIELDIDENARIEPLLDSIEKSGPRFRSLSVIGFFPANLARHESLLRRVVHLSLILIKNGDISFQGLQNVEELR
jgi:hypothetical protein